MLRRLNEIPGVSMADDAITRRPRMELKTLTNPQAMQRFFEVLDWMVEQMQTRDPLQSA